MTKQQNWLEERKTGVGGSDSSAILGLNPWKTNVDVWEDKIIGKTDNISNLAAVKYGKLAEAPLRRLFQLDHPQYKVISHPYLILRNKEYPFIMGSLDGELTDKKTGRKGVLEIKTTQILNSMGREKWKDKLPDNYYIQVLHYLLVTGWDFVVLKAQLKSDFGGELYIQTKEYFIERSDVLDDIEYLKGEVIKFWNNHILTKVRPALILPPI